jgi:hypothetical protein
MDVVIGGATWGQYRAMACLGLLPKRLYQCIVIPISKGQSTPLVLEEEIADFALAQCSSTASTRDEYHYP